MGDRFYFMRETCLQIKRTYPITVKFIAMKKNLDLRTAKLEAKKM